MTAGFIVLSVLLGLIGVVWISARQRTARRRQVLAQPFPESWRDILKKSLVPYAGLSDAERQRLHDCVHVLMVEKGFEGCGGLTLTDEMRVTIAGQACLLLVGHTAMTYPKLKTILVYPSHYIVRGDEGHSVRLGESWQRGVVVLAWDSVKGGARNFDDGHNVSLHEFAHQLDQEDGAADGAPLLGEASAYRSWAQCLGREYQRFQKRVKSGRKTVIDPYGATNPAEYFATATEAFFEKPETLARKRPELFDELQQYYKVDPRRWG